MLDWRPDSPIPDTIFGTGTGTAMDHLYQSGPGPDCPDGPCTFYLFIYSRLRTAGSCETAWHPAAISEPGAQHRKALLDPGPPRGPGS